MRRRHREIEKSTKLTVERLSVDSLDVRELKRLGMLRDGRWALSANLRWPSLSCLVGSRYWLDLEYHGRDTMQRVRISWTRCHLGGWRPLRPDSGHQEEVRCEACLGTKQDSSMRSPYPHRKILYVECPVCKGTGLKPRAS